MAYRLPIPATPAQIAMYGHTAAVLRKAMAAKGIPNCRTLNKLLRRSVNYTPTYVWLAAKGAPGPVMAKQVGKILGIPWESLLRRKMTKDAATETAPQPLIAGPMPVASAKLRAAEVLSFTADENGEVRIRLDVRLPMAQAMPLFRVLMDAGVLLTMDTPTDAE